VIAVRLFFFHLENFLIIQKQGATTFRKEKKTSLDYLETTTKINIANNRTHGVNQLTKLIITSKIIITESLD
jgi:hypothetical protein